jgi:DNA-binding CsgD family transcriptional regulator
MSERESVARTCAQSRFAPFRPGAYLLEIADFRSGRSRLATNVLELRRFDPPAASDDLPGDVTIGEKAEIRRAALVLARAASRHGLRIMVWHDLATLAPMTDAQGDPLNAGVFGWQEHDLAAWHDRDRMLASPVLRACRVESEPFWINRHGIRTRWPNRLLDPIERDDFEQRAAVRAAIILPVHLPFAQVAAAVLTSTDPAQEDLSEEFARCAGTLAEAVQRFVRGYVMVTRDERYLPGDTLLSSREIECLSWVAHGKTDFEISIILGCSHAGVRYHITRACAKLGVVNRAQSVFRASQLGYLGPATPAACGPQLRPA